MSTRAGFATLVLVLAAAAARADEAPPEATYTLSLAIDPATGEIQGEGEIALVNSSALPLDRVPLVLYPNRFARQDPRISDVNFARYYSYRFHAGEIRLERVVGAGGVPCELE